MDKEKLKEIGSYLLKGMTEKESCVLTDIPYSVYLAQKENDEPTRKYIEKKIIEFKKIHLEVIQKTSSEKNSMYLLEKLRPDEFGSKSKNEGPTINIMGVILKQIQNDDTSTIITFNRGEREKAKEEQKPRIHEGATLLN